MRLLGRTLLCLILGCVTTVAVAWGCAWRFAPNEPGGWTSHAWKARVVFFQDYGPDIEWQWHLSQKRRFGTERIHTSLIEAEVSVVETPLLPFVPPSWSDLPSRLGDLQHIRVIVQEASGWPRKCARWTMFDDTRAFGGGVTPNIEDAIPLPRANGRRLWQRHVRALPLRPIWPGFIINTLFYGVIWFGIFFAPGSARPALRKKRGHCPKCNYDLRGNREGDKGCSECGWGRPEDEA